MLLQNPKRKPQCSSPLFQKLECASDNVSNASPPC
eukprot:Gb_10013 [translate_table: standard]